MEKPKNHLGRRLVLFPSPFQGHLKPMLHLATLLHSQGFSITIIHPHFNSPNPTHFPNFTFHFFDDGLSCEAKTKPADSLIAVRALNKNGLQPFRDCLCRILSDVCDGNEAVACLISDPMWEFAASVADCFNLPRLSLRTSTMFSLLLYDSIAHLRENGYYPIQETKFDDPVLEFPSLKVRDLPLEEVHEILKVVSNDIKASKGIICNVFEGLEGLTTMSKAHETFPIPIFPIGPLHIFSQGCVNSIWEEDKSSISWLNTQASKSVIYVSFGSVITMTKTEFEEIAWGLANSHQPFLWVIRPGLIGDSKVIEPLPEGFMDEVKGRGHIVKWAPQEQVLAHPAVGGYWTHCGWNSTLESICQGVPLICTPFFADQPINARHVSDNWRIGLQVEKGARREEIEKAIKRLMVEEEGEEMRKRVDGLKDNARICLMEDGSSYKSLERLTSYLMSL